MRRHSVIFAAQVVEPDPAGTWVRHEEAEQVESQLGAAIKQATEELSALRKEHKDLQVELELGVMERDTRIARQEGVIKAARERLRALGHSPNCASRQGRISMDGQETHGLCNCGLDQWMKESGVG